MVKVAVKKESKKVPNIFLNFKKFSKNYSWGTLSIKDQVYFAKRLSFLSRASLPILESLHLIREQTRSKKYGKILDSIIGDVSSGLTLAKALSKFRKDFGDFAINIIAVGEEGGILAENLNYLADELKKKQLLRRKIISALIYPIFITIATLGITVLLTTYIFPRILPIFVSLKVELPITTRIMIIVSDFLRHSGVYLIVAIFVLILAFIFVFKRSGRFHFFIDRSILRFPFIGSMTLNYNLANISRTLALLLRGGMTLSEALPITARSISNLVYKNELDSLGVVVNRGEKLSAHLLQNRKLFPDILTSIVSVGERSGNLPETLLYLSELHESEVEDATKNLSSLLEPMLMVLMGLIVGFVAISVITPIYGITQHLSPR